MKLILSIVGQTVLLYLSAFAGFIVGITVPSLRVFRVVSHTATNLRTYDYDWIFGVGLMYLVLLLVGVARRRIRTSWIATTVALVLTLLIVLLFTQLGVKDTAINS